MHRVCSKLHFVCTLQLFQKQHMKKYYAGIKLISHLILALFSFIPLDYKLSNMEEVNLRFQHISEQIFGCLDNESFNKCLEVCRPWYNFLHGKKFLHARIILETVTKYHEVGKSWFQVFNKCNTKTIIDLRIAVEHLYQVPEIFASYRL